MLVHGLHLAVLAVAVALGLALASLPLNLARFLGFEVAVLREGVGELLAAAAAAAVLLPDLGEHILGMIIAASDNYRIWYLVSEGDYA